MGSRRRRKQQLTNAAKIATAILLVAAAGFVVWFSYPHKPKTNGMQEFFSDDDGKTWFVDDGTKIAPFDHDGKEAVLVKVFEDKDGKQFVGYLMKFTDEAKKKIVQGQQTRQIRTGLSAEQAKPFSGLMVKRPGDADWVSDIDPKGLEIKKVRAPDGSMDFLPVRP